MTELSNYEKALKNAQEAAMQMMVRSSEQSRALGISMTHLETAQLWAREDTREKKRIRELQEKGKADAS
jgi:uncharacterized protein YbjQ (UPF0145 family)